MGTISDLVSPLRNWSVQVRGQLLPAVAVETCLALQRHRCKPATGKRAQQSMAAGSGREALVLKRMERLCWGGELGRADGNGRQQPQQHVGGVWELVAA